jgi:hypothetical protein
MPRLPGLSTVAGGLRIMYVGLCLVVLSVLIWAFLPGSLIEQIGGLRTFRQMCAFGVLAGNVLHLVGQLLCMAVPRQTGAGPLIYLSIAVALVGLASQLMLLLAPDALISSVGPSLFLLMLSGHFQLAIFTVSTSVFLIGLSQINRYIGAKREATSANTAFWATLILVGLFVAVIVIAMEERPIVRGPARGPQVSDLLAALSLGLILFGLVWLVLYGNTLRYSSKALYAYERRPAPPEEEPPVLEVVDG